MRKKIIITLIILLILFGLFGWKILIVLKIDCLDLPVDSETVYDTKVWLSDVYWLHIKGEKVIKCSLGYEETKKYIETNNSALKLTNIDILKYEGMSDIAIYDSEFDGDFWKQSDRDNYIKISYLKKWID
jgi:hypothetical protein